MILAIGVDTVEVHRFALWHAKSYMSMRRIFSAEEIAYCLRNVVGSAERFAVRFAAKEAFAKAFNGMLYPQRVSFLLVCRAVAVEKYSTGLPYLRITWPYLSDIVPNIHTITFHLSLTHTKEMATAYVVAEKR